ncbi:MAG: tetratricopeptide repeat protein [Pseudomonadota bacterium]
MSRPKSWQLVRIVSEGLQLKKFEPGIEWKKTSMEIASQMSCSLKLSRFSFSVYLAITLSLTSCQPSDADPATGSEQGKRDDIEALAAACDRGDDMRCHLLGLEYALGDKVSQDYEKAASLFEKACASNIAEACAFLASSYHNGAGVEKDVTKATELDTLACSLGDGTGCKGAAQSYVYGDGVEQDFAQARNFAEEACEKGHAEGCRILANLYYEGQGVQQDIKQAARHYVEACNGSDAVSCHNVGSMLEGIDNVAAQKESVAYFQKSCDLDHGRACAKIGYLYATGEGAVAQDFEKAITAYKRGCSAGFEVACQDYRSLQEASRGGG